MKKKNGFTLIELLAVIIILGILMIIAIPSVTRYISDSRKNSYVDSAKEIVGSARNLVNSGELEMYDTDATYYIDINCIKTENAMKSPYGDFVKEGAYVVVTYDGKGYDYFWTSVDDAGQGIKDIVKYDKLDTDDISSDLTIEDISTLRTLDGRGKVILITERNSCQKEGAITENLIPVNSETGEEGGSSGGNPPPPIATSTILATAQTAGQLNRIGTTNIYIFKGGTTNPPANYVKFNDEDWRIIGIYGNQLKIIRVDSSTGQPTAPAAFAGLKWNYFNPNPGYSNSYIMEELNSSTTSYYNKLTNVSKEMIDENGKWNVGPVAENATAYAAYRSSTTSGTVGSTTHTTPWIGKVGMMASYEFLYASGGGDSCLTTAGSSYSTKCGTAANNWLLNTTSNTIWTINPRIDYANMSLSVSSSKKISSNGVTSFGGAVPAVFLKSSVRVASGDGTSGNPYILNLE